MTEKKYRLKMPLPDGSISGDIYEKSTHNNYYYNARLWNEAIAIDEGRRWETWQVENNPTWFEPMPLEVEKERIEVLDGPDLTGGGSANYPNHRSYAFRVSGELSKEKISAIKKAIEATLNNEPLYTQSEMDEARTEAFNAARKWETENEEFAKAIFERYCNVAPYFVYEDAAHFLSTKQSPTPSTENTAEKDWEVKSVKQLCSDEIFDTYRYPNWQYDVMGGQGLIHSVIRISDGVVFSVGDEITYSDEAHKMKITTFKLVGKDIWVGFGEEKNEWPSTLNGAKKLTPQPSPTPSKETEALFITEDGKEVFEEDTVFVLSTKSWLYHQCDAPSNPFFGDQNQFKYFSTEAAATEYITLNKPCLSVKDIQNISDTTFDFMKVHQQRLIQVAKSKQQ